MPPLIYCIQWTFRPVKPRLCPLGTPGSRVLDSSSFKHKHRDPRRSSLKSVDNIDLSEAHAQLSLKKNGCFDKLSSKRIDLTRLRTSRRRLNTQSCTAMPNIEALLRDGIPDRVQRCPPQISLRASVCTATLLINSTPIPAKREESRHPLHERPHERLQDRRAFRAAELGTNDSSASVSTQSDYVHRSAGASRKAKHSIARLRRFITAPEASTARQKSRDCYQWNG